jgi:transcriptional regulator with XRE-family HTH domain
MVLQPQQAFGKAVRDLRERSGLTQEALAELCDLDRTYISGIERGIRNPTIQTIWIIAAGLNVSSQELMKLTEDHINRI